MHATLNTLPALRSGAMLDEVLIPIHRRWRGRVAQACAPALLVTSTIWDRWSAVRYLNDAFQEQLGQERELIRRLPRIGSQTRERLEAVFETLERLRAQIDAAGRRHHTGGLVTVLLKNFLKQLDAWCTAIEHVARSTPLALLPDQALDLLIEIQARAPRSGVTVAAGAPNGAAPPGTGDAGTQG
jgi:hypothetical protein